MHDLRTSGGFQLILRVVMLSLLLTALPATGENLTLPASPDGEVNAFRLKLEHGRPLLRNLRTGVTHPLAPHQAVTIDGTGGDDLLTIDFSSGNPIPDAGLTFNGRGQATPAGDALRLTRSATFERVHYIASDLDGDPATFDGRIELTGRYGTHWIVYTGLEPIVDNTNATDREFTIGSTTPGDHSITVTDAAGTAGSSLIQSSGPPSFESIVFNNPTGSLTVNAGDGNNAITINTLDAAFAATVVINGDRGEDTITLNGAAANLDYTLNGNQDADVLTVNGTPSNGLLTLTGGNSPDVVHLNLAASGTTINVDGKTGVDTLNVASGLPTLTAFTATSIRANLGGDLATTQDQAWGGAVTLTADVELAANDVTFDSTVDSDGSSRSLTVNTSGGGTTTFAAAVGTTALAALTTNADGTTRLAANVITLGDQEFDDDVILTADVLLAGNDLMFARVDSDSAATPWSLTLNSSLAGSTVFNGSVGAVTPLNNLATNADGDTKILSTTLGASTVGTQTYADAVIVADGTTLASMGAVDFQSTVNLGASPGQVIVAAPFVLSSGATWELEIGGESIGLFDQFQVTGSSASLNGATLNLSLVDSFQPVGDEFLEIVSNDSPGAVGGTFSGRPQGDVFLLGDRHFQIDYEGGDGNDVLIRIPDVLDLFNGFEDGTRTFFACDTIMSDSYQILAPGNVTFHAGGQVILKHGFLVATAASFTVVTDTLCP